MPKQSEFELIFKATLDDPPGISSMPFTPRGLFGMADNSEVLYELDPATLEVLDRICLNLEVGMSVIPKPLKPDFEASAQQLIDGRPHLLIYGSGSKAGIREVQVTVDLAAKTFVRSSLAGLYQRLAIRAKIEVNVEGAAGVGDYVILANRGHAGQPVNHLAWVQNDEIKALQKLILPADPFVGIAELHYEADHDRLWLSASTEETSNTYDDGAIGDSYMGWIDRISERRGEVELTPDRLINLSELDPCFVGQKIESLTQGPEYLYLGADNDTDIAHVFVLKQTSKK